MIIFDEKLYAEKMLQKGFLTKHKNVYELMILSKYYFALDMDYEEVKKEIIDFCEQYVEYFSIEEWYKIINKTVEIGKRGKLVSGKRVEITKNELEQIATLIKLNERKLAFVMLVLYKFYGYKKFEVSIEDLYRLCKLNINSKTKLQLLQSLTSQEFIDINMGSKRWVKFAEKDGEVEITLTQFDDLIYEYLNYIGEGTFGNCEICNLIIKINGKYKKYCNACSKEVDREKAKDRMRKKRVRSLE